jgi:hypothetical protein
MKKIPLYILVIVFCNLNSNSCKAQVVYTDINPDSAIYLFSTPFMGAGQSGNVYYELDVNNDGICDFSFNLWGVRYDVGGPYGDFETAMYIDSGFCDSRNQIAFDSLNHQRMEIAPLNIGDSIFDPFPQSQNYPNVHFDTIFNGALFDSYSYASGMGGSNYGPWNINATNKFVGLKFYVNNSPYFGWVRMSISLYRWDPYFIIHDYAYEASGGSTTAGAGSSFTGIKENATEDIKVSPNPSRDEFLVKTSSGKTETLTIFDSFGKLILQDIMNTGKTFIEAKSWAPGMYLLHITDGEKTIVKKLIKE